LKRHVEFFFKAVFFCFETAFLIQTRMNFPKKKQTKKREEMIRWWQKPCVLVIHPECTVKNEDEWAEEEEEEAKEESKAQKITEIQRVRVQGTPKMLVFQEARRPTSKDRLYWRVFSGLFVGAGIIWTNLGGHLYREATNLKRNPVWLRAVQGILYSLFMFSGQLSYKIDRVNRPGFAGTHLTISVKEVLINLLTCQFFAHL
jgi:hypothetical protein